MPNLNLHVEIDERSGFCFGVTNAVRKAEENLVPGEKMLSVGEIVHNEEEVKRLDELGLETINREQFLRLKSGKVLFRAHGESPESYSKVREYGLELIDATCPIVAGVRKKVIKAWQNGEQILFFGKKSHPEVIGINGHINNSALVFESLSELNITHMPEKITLVSQTTFSLSAFHEIAEILSKAGKKVRVIDSVCRHVSNREETLVEFSMRFGKILFVSGKNSSNGKLLFEVCRKSNPSSFLISKPEEVRLEWFSPGDTVGIAGATSTPLWLMEKVRQFIETL